MQMPKAGVIDKGNNVFVVMAFGKMPHVGRKFKLAESET